MTTIQLQKLGIQVVQERNPRTLSVPGVGNIIVDRGETLADIFETVFEKGFDQGVIAGKKEKISEIKSCLNI